MDPGEVEGEALRVYALAGVDPTTALEPTVLVERLPWVLAVRWVVARSWPRSWRVETADGLDELFVHHGDSLPARNWRVVSEAVEGRFARLALPVADPAVKRVVSAVTSAVLVPRFALRRTFSELGWDLPQLAAAFGVSQITVARRLAEVKGMPLALVSPSFTRCYGLEASAAQLAAIVRRGTSDRWRVLSLTDTEGPLWAVFPRDW